MVDKNEEDLRKLGQELVNKLDKAIEDGIITREENDEICAKVKQIEEMILHDKIITKKEAKFMREIQKELEAHLNGVPKTF
jgi:hypothetical protein